jgi:flagellar basal-body rod protein FlgB
LARLLLIHIHKNVISADDDMPINFDKALGSHETALMLQARRTGVLASNIANADTPNYKARDIDFKSILQNAQSSTLPLEKTQPGHISPSGMGAGNVELKYRVPGQSSMDGNTVDLDREKAAFAENAVRYQATLNFLSGRFKGMMGALKGD